MPGLGEIAFSDLVKHPKLMILYAVLIGAGWLADKVIPSECEKDGERWHAAFYIEQRRADSLGSVNFQLNAQHVTDKAIQTAQEKNLKSIDSLLRPVGDKAKQLIENHGH